MFTMLGWASLKTARIILAILMTLYGAVLEALAWMGRLATEEPPVVLHLSIQAILFTGVTALLIEFAADK